MTSRIDRQKLRDLIRQNGPILASDKSGRVHRIDRDFADDLLLLDRVRDFFVFSTWYGRDKFLELLDANSPKAALTRATHA